MASIGEMSAFLRSQAAADRAEAANPETRLLKSLERSAVLPLGKAFAILDPDADRAAGLVNDMRKRNLIEVVRRDDLPDKPVFVLRR